MIINDSIPLTSLAYFTEGMSLLSEWDTTTTLKVGTVAFLALTTAAFFTYRKFIKQSFPLEQLTKEGRGILSGNIIKFLDIDSVLALKRTSRALKNEFQDFNVEKEIFRRIYNPIIEDILKTFILTKSWFIIKILQEYDLETRVMISERIQKPFKELAKIAKKFDDDIDFSDPNKALESIQDGPQFKSGVYVSSQVRREALVNIVNVIASSDIDKVLKVAGKMPEDPDKISVLASIAKKIAFLAPKGARKLYYEVFKLINENHIDIADCYEIFKDTPKTLLQEPRKIQRLVKDFDPMLKIYFLLMVLEACELESVKTLAKKQFTRLSNELQNDEERFNP